MPLGSEEAQAETAMWLFSNGGGYGDSATITVDTPENVEAVEFMAQLIEAGVTQPDAGATQRTPMLDQFIQGQFGMAVGLPPVVGMIEERNPDLNYSIVPFPSADGGESATLGVADHLMLPLDRHGPLGRAHPRRAPRGERGVGGKTRPRRRNRWNPLHVRGPRLPRNLCLGGGDRPVLSGRNGDHP